MAPTPVETSSDMHGVQRLASRQWPAGWHPGGLGWALARGEVADEVVVVRDGVDVVGWAGRGGHDAGELLAQVRSGRTDVAEQLVDWLLSSGATRLHIELYDGDTTLESVLIDAGFERQGHRRTMGVFRSADRASPQLPPGYVIRSVRLEKAVSRVEVHRAAWRPASLPYVDGRTLDPAAESSFSNDAYDAVRGAWLYDADLDLVVVAPDGSLAACCIVWLDPTTGVAEVEPLGVVPEHRRRGLAVALCLEAAVRVSERGGHQLFINTGPRKEYPAPGGAYRKAGFEVVERGTEYTHNSLSPLRHSGTRAAESLTARRRRCGEGCHAPGVGGQLPASGGTSVLGQAPARPGREQIA
jgi:ribosomal protein S18 acetylase RimI-like enzyme